MAVAASVEPMPVGLAGGSRDGIDTAQGGEGSLGVEAVRVTPGSNEEGRRRVWSYAEAIHQGWGCRPCESLDLGLQVLYLITELTVATGKGAKSILDSFVERPVRDGPWSARVSGREAPRAVGC